MSKSITYTGKGTHNVGKYRFASNVAIVVDDDMADYLTDPKKNADAALFSVSAKAPAKKLVEGTPTKPVPANPPFPATGFKTRAEVIEFARVELDLELKDSQALRTLNETAFAAYKKKFNVGGESDLAIDASADDPDAVKI